MSIKLALIGRNISHSHSPQIYQELLKSKLTHYELLDIACNADLPSVTTLLLDFNGISITAPYKQWAFNQATEISTIGSELKIANCLYMKDGVICGDLTDYYAAKEIMQREVECKQAEKVTILGDGAMGRMCLYIAQELGVKVKQFSRKIGWNGATEFSKFYVNTCLKEAAFPFKLPAKSYIWDLNYNYTSPLASKDIEYCDGKELLLLQAKYFLKLISLF